jgi:hypothetical protein
MGECFRTAPGPGIDRLKMSGRIKPPLIHAECAGDVSEEERHNLRPQSAHLKQRIEHGTDTASLKSVSSPAHEVEVALRESKYEGSER